MHIKNFRGKGRWYITTLIKDGANSANRPIVRGLFSVLKVFQLFISYPIL